MTLFGSLGFPSISICSALLIFQVSSFSGFSQMTGSESGCMVETLCKEERMGGIVCRDVRLEGIVCGEARWVGTIRREARLV